MDKERIALIAKLFILLCCSFLISCGINFFFIPHHIIDGGFMGIALVLNYLFQFPAGFTLFICSLPVYLLAWLLDRELFYSSIIGLVLSAFLIDVMYPFRHLFLRYIHLDPLKSALIGGALIGLGVGLMLKHRMSTGGTDLLALFLSRWSAINVGLFVIVMDTTVIVFGGMILAENTILISIIAVIAVGITIGLINFKKDNHSNSVT